MLISFNLISWKRFHVCRAMKFHYQEVSCRIPALWYNVMSKCIWYYGESSVCITHYVWPSICVIIMNHHCVLYIMSKYMCYYGESTMCIIYIVRPSIYGIMMNHQCVLYIMYAQVYVLLWWIISLYYILCMSKYMCYYDESSMCIIYYVCPIYVTMVNHQCVLYIMYVQVYELLWWIINVYYMLCMSKYMLCWIISLYYILYMSKYMCSYGKSSMCIIYYVRPSICYYVESSVCIIYYVYVIMVDHHCVLYIIYVSPYYNIHLGITYVYHNVVSYNYCCLLVTCHQQAASSVHFTTSYKHSLVLLRMGEIIACKTCWADCNYQ